MKKRNILYALLTVAVLMFVAIIARPVNTYAADDDDPGVAVDKKITVLEDGTYILDLDAFATGTVKTETVVKPCDLVLVLDVSTSMNQTLSGTTTRIQALVDAVNAFLEVVAEKNAENAAADVALSKVAIVYFSSDDNTGTLYGFREITSSNLVSSSVYATQRTWSGTTNWTTTGYGTNGNQLQLENYTWTDKGLSEADGLLEDLMSDRNYKPEDRNRVVVLFTDGYPNHDGGTSTTFQQRYANNVVNTARTIKTTRSATLFTVATLGTEAKPALNPQTATSTQYGGDNAQRVNQMLHAASSNYPQAQSPSNSSNFSVSSWGTGNYQAGFYKSATSASELSQIFTDIAESSASTETPLTSESIMKDIVSSSFTLPKGANVNTIEVTIVPWDSTNHKWSETTEYTPTQWKTACRNYGAEADENVTVTLSSDNKTIDVSGFDYGLHFLATSDPTQDVDNINAKSAKVHIKFPIQAKPSAVTGGEVATNGPESGIYLDGDATEPLIAFPQPKVVFTPVTYVVDYVTSDTSHDTKASSVKLDYSGVLKNVDMLDDPSDDYLIGIEASDFTYTIYKGNYGTISYGDDDVDVQRRYVRYVPTTMNWSDYDRIFIKGESARESDLDVWAMLCVIPANSVFYEDTYVTQTKTVTYNQQQVTIEYTGINYDSNWSTVGTEGTNQTYHAGDDMGWITGLADDTSFANDMAHTASTAKAKATFTFSGTGVDIYSRTNGSTGTVSINVTSAKTDNESGKKVSKTKLIDTKAAASDFFAIPVCTFTDLPYGKYTATISVTTGGQSEGRMTFYLDGVRVYNPIQPLEGDGNVIDMYTAKNLGAVFTEVRSMLGDKDTDPAKASAYYIDEHTTKEIVDDVAAITAAAKALAKAQQDRDDYVNTVITPAKNKVSNEEYALSTAITAEKNAETVYNAAVEAYDNAVAAAAAHPDDPALQEAVTKAKKLMDDKKDLWDEAVDALADAQTHYNDNYENYKADLAAKIADKAEYDEAVQDAIDNYDEVNDGATVAWYEGTLSDYQKEGPKSELLLAPGEQVAISVETGYTYYIGLRSLKGDDVNVSINGAAFTKPIAHTVDLYYECVPAEGKIVIKNTSAENEEGGNILSVTKLRTTGTGNTKSGTIPTTTEETLNFVRSLAQMSVPDYTGEVLTADGAAVAAESVLGANDIVIVTENEVEEETQATQPTQAAVSSLSRVLSSFFGFFRR